MGYDIEGLSRDLGFRTRELEKVLRITDVLEGISNVEFLKERLSLYGGTALNFVQFEDVPRLSVDLDFNYRHVDDRDWGAVRDMVDGKIGEVLGLKGYGEGNVNINPSYPLVRFDASYQNSLGRDDSFVLEIGYMRRIPILKGDDLREFPHLGGGKKFEVKTPEREELFANKMSTCIYRTSARDVYDVYRIAKGDFEKEKLRKCLVVESLMEGKTPLHEVDASERLDSISMDSGLENLLRKKAKIDSNKVVRKAAEFIDQTIQTLSEEEKDLIREFHSEKRFEPARIDDRGFFHEDISKHPAIQWTLQNL